MSISAPRDGHWRNQCFFTISYKIRLLKDLRSGKLHIIDLNDNKSDKIIKQLNQQPRKLTPKEKARLPKGQIPYGFKLSQKSLLIKERREQEILKKIIKLHKSGQSLRQICDYLKTSRIKTKNNKT